jgi:hypothetical protein
MDITTGALLIALTKSKNLAKLLDTIKSGVGIIYKPTQIRRNAKAKAYELETIAKAKSKIKHLNSNLPLKLGLKGNEADLINRINDSSTYQAIKKQQNIDSVIKIAAMELSNAENISKDPVDEDWTIRLINNSADSSSKYAQNLWGKILAGEIAKPGSYSLRTLEILKNMSQKEAEIFIKFGKFAMYQNNISFIINDENFLQQQNLHFIDKILLEEIGLVIQSGIGMEFKLSQVSDPNTATQIFFYDDRCIIINRSINTPKQSLPMIKFTQSGTELLKLISPGFFNKYYVELLASKLKIDGVKISHAKVDRIYEDRIEYSDIHEVI